MVDAAVSPRDSDPRGARVGGIVFLAIASGLSQRRNTVVIAFVYGLTVVGLVGWAGELAWRRLPRPVGTLADGLALQSSTAADPR